MPSEARRFQHPLPAQIIGSRLAILYRIAFVRMRVQAMGRLITRFIGHVLPGVIRPLRALWNQLIGFLFLVLASAPIPSIVRYVRHYDGDADNLFRIVLSFCFAGLMAYFGITSFLRARRISRS